MSSRLSLSKLSISFDHQLLCFPLVLKIFPNSLGSSSFSYCCFLLSLYSVYAFSSPSWLHCGHSLETVPSSDQSARGSWWSRIDVPTFLFAGNGLGCKGQLERLEAPGSSPGLISLVWFLPHSYHLKKEGEAAGAGWEQFICVLGFNWSAKQWVSRPSLSLC